MLYDAAGNMLQRKTVDAGVTTTLDYIAGIEYVNAATKSIMHGEGRVFITSPTVYRFEYTMSDHPAVFSGLVLAMPG